MIEMFCEKFSCVKMAERTKYCDYNQKQDEGIIQNASVYIITSTSQKFRENIF